MMIANELGIGRNQHAQFDILRSLAAVSTNLSFWWLEVSPDFDQMHFLIYLVKFILFIVIKNHHSFKCQGLFQIVSFANLAFVYENIA